MPPSAHVFQCLHATVYDLTGWALPDEGLRRLAVHLPDRVWQAAEAPHPALSRDVQRWCLGQQALLSHVIQQLQAPECVEHSVPRAAA